MTRYRVVWRHVVGVLMTLGTCVAFLVISRSVLIFTSVVLLVVVATVTWTVVEQRGWRWATRLAVVVTWASVASAGYLAAVGPAGVVLLAIVGLSSPPLVARCRRRETIADEWPVVPTSPSGREEVSAAAVWSAEQDLARQGWMNDSSQQMRATALCRAWRDSFVALGRPLSVSCKAGVVQRRREILDELERRNPAGFTAWLASGAEAAEDPRRYIVTQRDGESHL